MSKNKKRVLQITGAILAVFVLNALLVRVQGISFKEWGRLGYANAVKIFYYKSDEYPGHSVDCMRFPKSLLGKKGDFANLTYTEKGTGIDCNGYRVHVGDSKDHVKDQFASQYSENDGTSYELGCYFCDTGYMLEFTFTYNADNIVEEIEIIRRNY